jgi:hypothetical protein
VRSPRRRRRARRRTAARRRSSSSTRRTCTTSRSCGACTTRSPATCGSGRSSPRPGTSRRRRCSRPARTRSPRTYKLGGLITRTRKRQAARNLRDRLLLRPPLGRVRRPVGSRLAARGDRGGVRRGDRLERRRGDRRRVLRRPQGHQRLAPLLPERRHGAADAWLANMRSPASPTPDEDRGRDGPGHARVRRITAPEPRRHRRDRADRLQDLRRAPVRDPRLGAARERADWTVPMVEVEAEIVDAFRTGTSSGSTPTRRSGNRRSARGKRPTGRGCWSRPPGTTRSSGG